MTASRPAFMFDNSYARELPAFVAPATPARVPAPSLLFFNANLAQSLGYTADANDSQALANWLSGNDILEGSKPVAQVYAGHQFGHFSPQLGDGRALLLGEIIDPQGHRRDLALKGSGRTPFSRTGDGKAAIGPMLREALISEAMHALGIPTTRSLAVVATGEPVYREDVLPGAVLTRVASSHIRVGTFEYFAARGEVNHVRLLADYSIARHYPAIASEPDRYLNFLRTVAKKQASLIAQWMNAGFIHGVMNTDNMAISGETIDYGPCAFMEAYSPDTVFSSIDRHGRYAFGNQPTIAQWNLARLAETLLPLLSDDEPTAIAMATGVLDEFPDHYQHFWLKGIRAKLGLQDASPTNEQADLTLALDWLTILKEQKVDFTLGWRYLADTALGNDLRLRSLFNEPAALDAWLSRWKERCAHEDGQTPNPKARIARMHDANPWIIPRNHRVEEALQAASTDNNLEPFNSLLSALQNPFQEDTRHARYAEPAPASVTACYKTFCGT